MGTRGLGGFAAGLMLLSGTVHAQETAFVAGVRLGPTVGNYTLKNSVLATDGQTGASLSVGGPSGTFSSDDSSFAYGLQAAPWARYGKFFGEVSLDVMSFKINGLDANRTDVVPAVGYSVGDKGALFVGYRRGMQGDSYFNDDFFSESGFVLGAGVGNLVLDSLVFSGSFAYNLSKVDDFGLGGGDFDYNGVSAKVGVAMVEYPAHVLQLRFQRFSGSDSDSTSFDINADGVADRVKSKLEETYVQLIYLYNFAF